MAIGVTDWVNLINNVKRRSCKKKLLLLGDHSQSLDGRYIKDFSSRKARIKSFLNELIGKSELITVTTRDLFEQWKAEKSREVIKNILKSMDKLPPQMKEKCSEQSVTHKMEQDLETSFLQISNNLPPFAPMFEELFNWFHWVRFYVASQNLLLSSAVQPISPTMSMRSLRLISRVHPRLRIRRRLISAIAKLPDFNVLAKIPSAQIPWISARAPKLLSELLWGLRSRVDQLLIRRVLKCKDPNKRQRVLKSMNLIKEYRQRKVIPNVSEWFSGKWVRGEPYIQIVEDRANMKKWPLINSDITVVANVSIILDNCKITESAE